MTPSAISNMHFPNTCYDISVTLGSESIDHPGAIPYSRKLIWGIKKGNACDLSELNMTTHTGTHIDAPAHFIPQGKSIDQYPASDFILPAHVVNIDDKELIRAAHLERIDSQPGDALLFRTRNSVSGISKKGPLSKEYISLTLESAEICVRKKVKLVGIDYVTIDPYSDRSFGTHRKLLENGVLILEGINLNEVPEGKYTLICLPLKIEGAEASPVRAVLLC
jgi:arylformamidase